MYQGPLNETGARRLTTIRDTEDGFRIAEEDLAMRGAGDLIGTAQSGSAEVPGGGSGAAGRADGAGPVRRAEAVCKMTDSLTSPRGQAARALLWLMDQDRAIHRGLWAVG